MDSATSVARAVEGLGFAASRAKSASVVFRTEGFAAPSTTTPPWSSPKRSANDSASRRSGGTLADTVIGAGSCISRPPTT